MTELKCESLSLIWARITSFFSFPMHTCAYFAHKLQNVFNVVTNRDKTETQNALYNFSKSPHMCRSPDHMAWCIVWLVNFALYTRLAICDCWCCLSGCFMRFWLAWAFRAWERERVWRFCLFVSVDVNLFVNVFIYYNCMGRLSVRV